MKNTQKRNKIDSKKSLSIIVPCYNESNNLPHIVAAFHHAYIQYENNRNFFKFELILVNNGSTDATASILQTIISQPKYFFVKIVTVKVNQGYGFGILQGLMRAKGAFIGWTHADMQTPPADCFKAFELIANSSTTCFVKGKRMNRPLADILFTLGMSVFSSMLLSTLLYDINAQPKLFKRSFFSKWVNPPHDFSLDLYAYYQAKQQDLNIKTFPVQFCKRLYGESKWAFCLSSKINTILRTIRYILALRNNKS